MNMNHARIREYTDVFASLSESTRLRILRALAKAKNSLSVCEIMDALDESQYNISRHLRVLKNCGLVEERKQGKWVLYFLPEQPGPFRRMLLQCVMAVPRTLLISDEKRLEKRLALRVKGECVIGVNRIEWRRIRDREVP
jgi:ArsR family transcriptional regulator